MIKATEIRQIHRGRYLSYYEIDYINLDGRIKTYEMVSKNHNLTLDTIGRSLQAIVLLVFNEDHSKMLLSKEFRMGVNQFVINTPAGLIDAGETPEIAAARELREETGLNLTKIIEVMGPSFSCAPVTDDMSKLIICEANGEIALSDSPDEEVYAKWYSKNEVRDLLNSGEYAIAARTQAFCWSWVNEM